MRDIQHYLRSRAADFEEDLCRLLRIPSVSADGKYRSDVERAAQWIADQFERLGVAREVIPTAGHPLVYAETPAVPGAPRVLVYGHYDVQPPDPLGEWISPPFEPTRRDGDLFARGATDDKGQLLTHVKSLEAWMRVRGGLPLQVKFLIEGEEEVGSEHLDGFLRANAERLACDVVVISDSSQFSPDLPAITYGLRGIAYFELRVTGPRQDLHSGTFGGSIMNPANALTAILARLIDDRGRIQVPGFYDDVLPLTDQERSQFRALPFDEDRFQGRIGVPKLHGEDGYTTLERRWARPTFDINGLWSGYQGEGSKTVLPARAGAKFSFRLVPNQNPAKVAECLRGFLASVCPPGVTYELIEMHGGAGYVADLSSPYLAAAARAIERGFGTAPVFIREGGSIPIVSSFRKHLKADSLLLGWGLDDDNAHGPNEKLRIADFHRGIAASAHLWNELASR
ncbi:MAG: dipeptidase [Planctomycetes bacterium]|nr:dipeptidase [Planctomycetota bacterium]